MNNVFFDYSVHSRHCERSEAIHGLPRRCAPRNDALSHKFSNNNLKGFTVVEILIAIVLISILSVLSFPAWHHLISKNRVEITTRDLLQLVKTSRQFALEKNQSVIICASHDKIHCQNNGISNYIIAQSQGQIMAELFIDARNSKVRWISNLGKNDQLIFMPNGMTNGQQGHFTVSSTTSPQESEIVVLMSGSAYVRSRNLSMALSK